MRFDGERLHGNPFALENLRDVVRRGLLVARRALRVHAHERLEMPERLGLDRRPIGRRTRLRGCAVASRGDA